jgi:hypothetical protein
VLVCIFWSKALKNVCAAFFARPAVSQGRAVCAEKRSRFPSFAGSCLRKDRRRGSPPWGGFSPVNHLFVRHVALLRGALRLRWIFMPEFNIAEE